MKNLLVFLLIIFSYCTTFSQDSLHFSFRNANIGKTGQSSNTQTLSQPSEPQTTISTLWGWMGNTRGELGDGTNLLYRERPIQLSTDNWLIISGGYSHSLGIKSDSTLWAWGENISGAFGNGTTNSSNIPIKIGTEKNWKFASAGDHASYAIKSDGSLWVWGNNSSGDLGDSTYYTRYVPIQIGKSILGKVKYVLASGRGAAAINEDGFLFTWGHNEFGTIGDGTFNAKNYPVKIGNTGEWLTFSSNGIHIIAIKTNGTLWAWGDNRSGQLGDGTYISQNKPLQIGNDSDWVDVSCEMDANLALKKDGSLWAWGKNINGELGDSTMVSKNYPIQVGKDKDWMIARSKRVSCEAVKKDGSFWYWGHIRNNETLNSDTILVPTKMKNITNVIQLSRSSRGTQSLFLRNYKAKPAKIITLSSGNITSTSAEVGGKILSTEGEKIYQRGFCYDYNNDPSISANITRNGIDLGEYHTTLTNLLPFTKYSVRAYVTTAAGDAYGDIEIIYTKLASPLLIKPEKNKLDVPLKITFIWNEDMNALKYRFQLSKFADFSKIEVDTEIVDSNLYHLGLELNNDYFWRVQAINEPFSSDWSEVYSFHTIKFNEQTLITPKKEDINIPIDCQLNWNLNTNSSSFILQVSNDESFYNFILDTIVTDNTFRCSKLDYLKSYNWRVRSFIGTDSSNWSPIWKFTTLMDSVKLISPEDLLTNLGLTQNFVWEKGIYNKDYRLQVSKNNDFTNVIFDTLLNQKYSDDIKNLKYYTKYFWRVRNESGDTLGYWSKIRQFKTRMTDVQLIYPENDKTGLDQKIKFIWSAVFGTEFYHLQISKNDQFTDIVYSKDSIQSTEFNVPDLELNTLYYWRVRPWNSESTGTLYWSEVWSFRTGSSSVSDVSNLIQIIPNPAGDFVTVTLAGAINPMLKHGIDIPSDIVIYNTLGEKVTTVGAIHELHLQINISDLPKGIYFVKAGTGIAKFVKI